MMRKIEKEMIEAIKAKKDWSNSNTSVSVSIYPPEETTTNKGILHITVRLGRFEILNIINDKLIFSDVGFKEKIFQNRLNTLLTHFGLPTIYSKEGQWFIGNEVWRGLEKFVFNPETQKYHRVDIDAKS